MRISIVAEALSGRICTCTYFHFTVYSWSTGFFHCMCSRSVWWVPSESRDMFSQKQFYFTSHCSSFDATDDNFFIISSYIISFLGIQWKLPKTRGANILPVQRKNLWSWNLLPSELFLAIFQQRHSCCLEKVAWQYTSLQAHGKIWKTFFRSQCCFANEQ